MAVGQIGDLIIDGVSVRGQSSPGDAAQVWCSEVGEESPMWERDWFIQGLSSNNCAKRLCFDYSSLFTYISIYATFYFICSLCFSCRTTALIHKRLQHDERGRRGAVLRAAWANQKLRRAQLLSRDGKWNGAIAQRQGATRAVASRLEWELRQESQNMISLWNCFKDPLLRPCLDLYFFIHFAPAICKRSSTKHDPVLRYPADALPGPVWNEAKVILSLRTGCCCHSLVRH